MHTDVATVKEFIERAAAQVKASPSFVASVLELFKSKGISLESRAEPYMEMIERAFSSHGVQRETFARIHNELNELSKTLRDLQRAWLELADKTRQIEDALRRRQGANAALPARPHAATPERDKSREKDTVASNLFGFGLVGRKLLPN